MRKKRARSSCKGLSSAHHKLTCVAVIADGMARELGGRPTTLFGLDWPQRRSPGRETPARFPHGTPISWPLTYRPVGLTLVDSKTGLRCASLGGSTKVPRPRGVPVHFSAGCEQCTLTFHPLRSGRRARETRGHERSVSRLWGRAPSAAPGSHRFSSLDVLPSFNEHETALTVRSTAGRTRSGLRPTRSPREQRAPGPRSGALKV